MRRAPLFALAVLGAAACAAGDGAALVHGRLYAGQAPWDTSLEFTGEATAHGAAPFRIALTRTPAPSDATGRGGLPAGLTIEILDTWLPKSGERRVIGGAEGPRATAVWIPRGSAEPTAQQDGPDRRWSDGGFEAHAASGWFEVTLDGRAPGSAIRGRFELVFRTGETVRGTFATLLAD